MADIPTRLLELGPRFKSFLPDYESGWTGTLGGAFDPDKWSSAMVKNATLLTGHLAQNVASQIGWPQDGIANLHKLAGLGLGLIDGTIPIDDAIKALIAVGNFLRAQLSGRLAEIQSVVVAVLDSVASYAPIIGWVVQIGLFLQKSITLGLERNMPVADDRPIAWNKTRDEDEANALLGVLETDDWTPIWTPPMGAWGTRSLSYDPWGKVSGWAFGPHVELAALEGTTEEGRHGYIPGRVGLSGRLGAGRYFQGPVWSTSDGKPWFSEECSTENKGCPHPSPLNWRSLEMQTMFVPSAANLAAMAWAHMAAPSGSCGNVDFGYVEQAWQKWTEQGVRLLEQRTDTASSGDPRDEAIAIMLRTALGYNGNLYGQSGVLASLQVRDAVVAQRRQFWRLLGTIACAYVPSTAPALNNAQLRERWAHMQQLLLQDDARYDVELDLVPPGPFREKLVASRKTPKGIGLKAPGLSPSRRRRRTLDGGAEPDRPRLPPIPTEGGGGEEIIALLAAAAALLFV